MAKYTFTCEHFNYNDFNGNEMDVASKHTTEFRADDLTTMLENFESFLRGAGFHFDGVIDIVPPEKEISWDEEETGDTDAELSKRVFDHMVKDLTKNNDDIVVSVPNQYSFNFETMNDSHGTYKIDDGVDFKEINFSLQESSFEETNCPLCKLPVSVMQLHQCFDPKCPCGAYRNQFYSDKINDAY
jgi:hypothetical protein